MAAELVMDPPDSRDDRTAGRGCRRAERPPITAPARLHVAIRGPSGPAGPAAGLGLAGLLLVVPVAALLRVRGGRPARARCCVLARW